MGSLVVLLTGASGFLGSRVCKELLRLGHRVVVLKRRTSNLRRVADAMDRTLAVYDIEDGVSRAFDEHSIEAIVHCATDYGRKNEDPLHTVQANLLLPLTLLQEGRKRRLRVFLNTDTLLDKRVNDYSLSKRQFSEWLQNACSRSSEMIGVNVAVEHFYGPDDDRSKFVSWTIDRLLTGPHRVPLTLGEQKRDFIYVDDVVDALGTLLQKSFDLGAGYHRFEVGTGHSTPIRDIVSEISRLCEPHGCELAFGALPYRAHEVMDSRVDLEPLKKLGWRPRFELADGLKRTVEQERKNRAAISPS